METMTHLDLSRLPENTALKQQTLPFHRLHFSASLVLSIFFITGIFCLCMGIILLLSAKTTREIEINYTNICANCAQLRENPSNFDKECTCSIPFYLSQKMEGDVYMYYKLHGFYQNLHRYTLSRSNSQLVGKDIWNTDNCAPFHESPNGTPIVPCGAIANSVFNDTIILSYDLNSSIHMEVPMLKSGLTWWTDKYIKFQNPKAHDLADKFAGSAKPPSWAKPIYELDRDDPRNNGFLNEDFIVWMRTAAFPTFKNCTADSIVYTTLQKAYLLVFTVSTSPTVSFYVTFLTEGEDFPVTGFRGEKSVVLSTLTWSGGGSLFLGLTYTVTGALTWLASFAIMAVYLTLEKVKCPSSRSEVEM